MKKRILKGLALILGVLTLASCGGNNNQTTPQTNKPKDTEGPKKTEEIKHVHEWNEVEYTWSIDNSKCTAKRVCKGDNSHVESETVNTSYEVVTPAKCLEDGTGKFSADFKTNEAFVDQTKVITIDAFGHEWDEVTYTWSADNSACTASRTCLNDSLHVETETVNTTVVTKNPTEEEDGSNTYTATFTGKDFDQQTKEVLIRSLPTLDKLEFTYHAAESAGETPYYSVRALNKQIFGRVTIPATYKGVSDTVEVPVTEIEVEGFRDCDYITYVNIPGSIKVVGSDRAFANCSNIVTVILNEGTGGVGRRAFQSCVNLTSIYIPASFLTTGNQGFQLCTSLSEVIFAEGSKLSLLDNNTFASCGSLTEFVVPSGVESINGNAFYNCTGLEKITLPASITEIRTNAFNTCSKLEELYFEGTKEQWSSINFSESWKDETLKTIHCSDGDITL